MKVGLNKSGWEGWTQAYSALGLSRPSLPIWIRERF